jgi:hypothetical protein
MQQGSQLHFVRAGAWTKTQKSELLRRRLSRLALPTGIPTRHGAYMQLLEAEWADYRVAAAAAAAAF